MICDEAIQRIQSNSNSNCSLPPIVLVYKTRIKKRVPNQLITNKCCEAPFLWLHYNKLFVKDKTLKLNCHLLLYMSAAKADIKKESLKGQLP